LGKLTPGEYATVNYRVKRLHPTIEYLRETGEL
jgi:hypothetical protein